MRQDIENLNKLIEQNESTSLLITGTSYDFSAISNELEKNTKSFTIELARELVEPLRGLAKELQLNEIDKLLEKGESLDNLSERVDSLSFESKSFGQKNKRAVGIIAVLGDFWENHWGKCMLTGALIISIYFNSKLIAFIFDLKPKF
jgi:hypothetical protein